MAACQTTASSKKNIGITGLISIIGRNKRYDSGNTDNRKIIFTLSYNFIVYFFFKLIIFTKNYHTY